MDQQQHSESSLYPYPIKEIEDMAADCGLSVDQVVNAFYMKEAAQAKRLTDAELADALIWNVWVDVNPKKCPWPFALLDEAIARLNRGA
jgi:hypothetical protein